MIPLQTEVMLAVKDAAKTYSRKSDEEQMWEQRRYEIAKRMLPALHRSFEGSMKWQCETAIRYADELIKMLKGGGNDRSDQNHE